MMNDPTILKHHGYWPSVYWQNPARRRKNPTSLSLDHLPESGQGTKILGLFQ
jgi:hypothetical protein